MTLNDIVLLSKMHCSQSTLNPPKFLRSPFMIRVPFFQLLGCNKGALKQKGQKGTTQEPSSRANDDDTSCSIFEAPNMIKDFGA